MMEWPTTLCDLGMSGLDFVGSKAGIMLGVVGSLDLVLPLNYYRWETVRALNCQIHMLVFG